MGNTSYLGVYDTLSVNYPYNTGDDEVGYPTKYIEHARWEGKDRIITLTSRFAVVDGKVDVEDHFDASSNYFVCVDKKTVS